MPRTIAALEPSRRRKVFAVTVYALIGASAIWLKFQRNTLAVPDWVTAVAPNFLPAMALPFMVFLRPGSVTFREYWVAVGGISAGLMAYEVAQIWMPKRTFDWGDLAATALGGLVGGALGSLEFFRDSLHRTRRSHAGETR
jgi:hypothetical protein